MGGLGSGDWLRWREPKATVESCYSLDSCRWASEGIILPGWIVSGSYSWYRDKACEQLAASIGYRVKATEAGTGVFEIGYDIGQAENRQSLSYSIILQTTRPNYGGIRWWFTCPLTVGGIECRRRVRILYLASGYFGCRDCHHLTYRSSREAHKVERAKIMLNRLRDRPSPVDFYNASPSELLTLCRASLHGE